MGASEFLSQRRANHQAPNPKLQKSPGIETPKTKLQTPKKSQVQSSKPQPALRAWSFSGVWCLVFETWSLELGACRLDRKPAAEKQLTSIPPLTKTGLLCF